MATTRNYLITCSTALAAATLVAAPAPVMAQQAIYSFDIPAQNLATALARFGRATKRQLVFNGSAVRRAHSNAVKGRFMAEDGLARLLQGSGFVARSGRNNVLIIEAAPVPQASTVRAQEESTSSSGDAAGLLPEEEAADIVVTGSRIERAGFDQPTPTTMIGPDELRQGARQNLAQVLNDSPQFRPSTSPQVTPGQTTSGTAPVDLRGLGAARTLTLLNGRRFVGQNNLNYVPMNLVERVEVVTGGASAAYGSDAVAGVVNIILKDKFEGFSIGGQTGISSRGDGMRYGADAMFGTSFADGSGHVLLGAEYVNEKAISDRASRPNLGAGIVPLDPADPTGPLILVRDVNDSNRSSGGLIRSGILAGQTFNDDGSLRPFRAGTFASAAPAQMIGGEDGVSLADRLLVTTPVKRINAFARVSYDLGAATLWADASYGRSESDSPFVPDIGVPAALAISAANPFLSADIRNQLANAGETSFTFGKLFDGPFQLRYAPVREQVEGAVGIEGRFGAWKFDAHYSHGEVYSRLRMHNSRVVSRFNNAVNAVSSNGQTVCAINADASAANDDPACRPLDLFGRTAASADALDYVTDTQRTDITTKLDSVAGQVQGDLFSLWAAPLTVAFGVEARWEEQSQRSGALDLAGAFGPLNLYGSPVQGGFNVKEGFGELVLPLFDIESTAKVDLNGAARYSDYSRSGGIWSWKVGGTAELFGSLLLRATNSRDIRAPTVADLFTTMGLSLQTVTDQDTEGRLGIIPGYSQVQPQVRVTVGGNPDLQPEISKTLTFGATFSPLFLRGFNLSVDYYDIKISGAIATLSGTNLTLACRNGSAAACAQISRDPITQNVIAIEANAQNIASFETKGIDFEASYSLPLARLSESLAGSLRIRALATYVKDFIFDTGVSRVDTAGDVGDSIANALPKWRGLLSFAYQGEVLGLDARLRYLGGGTFNQLNSRLVNNEVGSRIYLDLGAQWKVMDRFTFFGNVNNVFDRKPPLTTLQNTFYDVVGTYFTAGARVNF